MTYEEIVGARPGIEFGPEMTHGELHYCETTSETHLDKVFWLDGENNRLWVEIGKSKAPWHPRLWAIIADRLREMA